MKFRNILSISTTVVLGFLFSNAAYSLTLREVVKHTVDTNPQVLLSEHVRQSSMESVNVARAGYLPTIDATAGLGKESTRSPNTAFVTNDLDRHEFGLSLQQMLFDGFGTLNDVRRTQYKTNADAYAISGESNDQAILATEAYLNILQNQQLVAIARDHYNRIHGIYNLVKERSESGLGREADMYQARGRLELSIANLYALKNDLRDAKTAFRKVTGMEPVNLIKPTDVPMSLLPRSRMDAVKYAITTNPKLKGALADVAEAESQYKMSKAVNVPRLDLFAGINRDRNLAGQPGGNNNALVILRASFNIFHGFGDVAKQHEDAYAVDQAADIRNETLRELIQSVRFSWDSIATAQVRLPPLLAHRTASYGTVKAYQEQFTLGRRTLLDLLDSENELFRSRLAYVREHYLLRISKYRLMADANTLLRYFHTPFPATAKVPYKEILVLPRVYPDVGVINSDANHMPVIQRREAESKRHTSPRAKDALFKYGLPAPRG